MGQDDAPARRVPQLDLGAEPHAHDVVGRAVDLADHQHLVVGDDRQMDRLADFGGQAPHIRSGDRRQAPDIRQSMRQLEQEGGQHVTARRLVLGDVAALFQHRQHPEDLADGAGQGTGDVRQTQPEFLARQQLDDVEALLEGRRRIFLLFRGHDAFGYAAVREARRAIPATPLDDAGKHCQGDACKAGCQLALRPLITASPPCRLPQSRVRISRRISIVKKVADPRCTRTPFPDRWHANRPPDEGMRRARTSTQP